VDEEKGEEVVGGADVHFDFVGQTRGQLGVLDEYLCQYLIAGEPSLTVLFADCFNYLSFSGSHTRVASIIA